MDLTMYFQPSFLLLLTVSVFFLAQDGNVLTSSGVSAGMDLTLYFIAKVIDEQTAEEVARYAEYDGQWTDSPANKWSEPGS